MLLYYVINQADRCGEHRPTPNYSKFKFLGFQICGVRVRNKLYSENFGIALTFPLLPIERPSSSKLAGLTPSLHSSKFPPQSTITIRK